MYDLQIGIWMGFMIYTIIGSIYAYMIDSDYELKANKKEMFTAGVLWPLILPITLIKGLSIFWKILRK